MLLVLLGGALAKIALDGSALNYVKPGLLPWLAATGFVVVVLGLLAVARDVRAHQPAPDQHHHGRGARSPWLLLLPVLAIFLVAPPALGASSVGEGDGRSVATSSGVSTQTFPPLPAGDAPEVSLVDLVQRSVWDRAGSLDGREVTLTGFVVRGAAGGTDLARLVISCCAADALPVRVQLDVGARQAAVDAMVANTWLVVRGTVVGGSATKQNGYVPTLTVASWSTVVTPGDPYEY